MTSRKYQTGIFSIFLLTYRRMYCISSGLAIIAVCMGFFDIFIIVNIIFVIISLCTVSIVDITGALHV